MPRLVLVKEPYQAISERTREGRCAVLAIGNTPCGTSLYVFFNPGASWESLSASTTLLRKRQKHATLNHYSGSGQNASFFPSMNIIKLTFSYVLFPQSTTKRPTRKTAIHASWELPRHNSTAQFAHPLTSGHCWNFGGAP